MYYYAIWFIWEVMLKMYSTFEKRNTFYFDKFTSWRQTDLWIELKYTAADFVFVNW